MKDYSKEVIKAAEELIEKHLEYSASYMEEGNNKDAIKAAIVSCEFSQNYEDGAWQQHIRDIKSYLEELL